MEFNIHFAMMVLLYASQYVLNVFLVVYTINDMYIYDKYNSISMNISLGTKSFSQRITKDIITTVITNNALEAIEIL